MLFDVASCLDEFDAEITIGASLELLVVLLGSSAFDASDGLEPLFASTPLLCKGGGPEFFGDTKGPELPLLGANVEPDPAEEFCVDEIADEPLVADSESNDCCEPGEFVVR